VGLQNSLSGSWQSSVSFESVLVTLTHQVVEFVGVENYFLVAIVWVGACGDKTEKTVRTRLGVKVP